MKLLTLESYEKEQAIYAAWGTQDWFWTSITDSLKEGHWFWQSTGTDLYPGYANWCDSEPRNGDSEDFMMLQGCWNVIAGSTVLDAICQSIP
ncbi:hypothetical protein OUZ56_014716 [Daphnia magna]|uniref:C-type lectin domain-containing protein n=1 Tax=Daphnia magna TaxID=35525 RepID=A0ABR0AL03_9CRUS|nr:hypothetical protein OUZ56_014716 [Daphnia magna]